MLLILMNSCYSYILVLVAPGSLVGQLKAHDDDDEGTLNAQLTYSFQDPDSVANIFSIEAASGRIQALRSLQRRDKQVYNFNVRVSDPGNTHTV